MVVEMSAEMDEYESGGMGIEMGSGGKGTYVRFSFLHKVDTPYNTHRDHHRGTQEDLTRSRHCWFEVIVRSLFADQ